MGLHSLGKCFTFTKLGPVLNIIVFYCSFIGAVSVSPHEIGTFNVISREIPIQNAESSDWIALDNRKDHLTSQNIHNHVDEDISGHKSHSAGIHSNTRVKSDGKLESYFDTGIVNELIEREYNLMKSVVKLSVKGTLKNVSDNSKGMVDFMFPYSEGEKVGHIVFQQSEPNVKGKLSKIPARKIEKTIFYLANGDGEKENIEESNFFKNSYTNFGGKRENILREECLDNDCEKKDFRILNVKVHLRFPLPKYSSIDFIAYFFIGDALQASPKEVSSLLEMQSVRFRYLPLFLSPYYTINEATTLRLSPNTNIVNVEELISKNIKFSEIPGWGGKVEHDAMKRSIDHNSTITNKNHIVAFHLGDQLNLHFEFENHLGVITSLSRKIVTPDLSNFIFVDEQFEFENRSPCLKTEFQRNQVIGELSAQPSARSHEERDRRSHVVKHFVGVFPREIQYLEYFDFVGNITTSSVSYNTTSNSNQYLAVNFQPRFLVLGSWKTDWKFQYYLPKDTAIKVFYPENQGEDSHGNILHENILHSSLDSDKDQNNHFHISDSAQKQNNYMYPGGKTYVDRFKFSLQTLMTTLHRLTGNQYIMSIPLGPSISGIFIEEFINEIDLPYGATDVKLSCNFGNISMYEKNILSSKGSYYWLDMLYPGRRILFLKGHNIFVPDPELLLKKITVFYTYNVYLSFAIKFIYLFFITFIPIMLWIIWHRIDLTISSIKSRDNKNIDTVRLDLQAKLIPHIGKLVGLIDQLAEDVPSSMKRPVRNRINLLLGRFIAKTDKVISYCIEDLKPINVHDPMIRLGTKLTMFRNQVLDSIIKHHKVDEIVSRDDILQNESYSMEANPNENEDATISLLKVDHLYNQILDLLVLKNSGSAIMEDLTEKKEE